jgi:hypothetical protein
LAHQHLTHIREIIETNSGEGGEAIDGCQSMSLEVPVAKRMGQGIPPGATPFQAIGNLPVWLKWLDVVAVAG